MSPTQVRSFVPVAWFETSEPSPDLPRIRWYIPSLVAALLLWAALGSQVPHVQDLLKLPLPLDRTSSKHPQ